MISAILLILAGVGLLLSLLVLWPRGRFTLDDRPDPAAPGCLISPIEIRLSQLLVEEILCRRDYEFVMREAPELHDAFLRGRRTIALYWISRKREAAKALMQMYRARSRATANANPVLTIRLAANYYAFLVVCALAEYCLNLRGPFASVRMVERILSAGERIRFVSEGLLRRVNSSLFEEFGTKPVL